jgi:hypothetical protein
VTFSQFHAWPALAVVLAVVLAGQAGPARAAQESFLRERGSKVGPATKVKPVNCVTAADGSITCDTKLENPPGDTPARPNYQPFDN